jgi:hypothetical protein
MNGIWIRSQDKTTLAFINTLCVEADEDGGYGISGNKRFYQSDEDNDYWEYEDLGAYPTEARALEVLDEIQQFIKDEYNIQGSSGVGMFTPIFDMPIE